MMEELIAMWGKEDMRRSPRIPLERFVVTLRQGDQSVSGNLSSGGVGFTTRDPVRLGDAITVRFSLPESGELVMLSAVICHVSELQAGYYAGARFVDVDVLVQNPLDRYVEETALSWTVGHPSTDLRLSPRVHH
jgi:PilZ domain-containing protein